MEVDEGFDKKSDILSHWMAAHARLKNEFTEDEKYHNLMTAHFLSVVGILTIKEVYTKKELTCSTSFSCSKSCAGTMGYKCGDDGCPICECLSQVHTGNYH